jgi:hypothetical protein
MRGQFTLEFWRDGDFYELIVTQERAPAPLTSQREPVELEV